MWRMTLVIEAPRAEQLMNKGVEIVDKFGIAEPDVQTTEPVVKRLIFEEVD